MWVYFNEQGNVNTRIPHGEIIRQQSSFNLVLAFEPAFFNKNSVQELYEYLKNDSVNATIHFKKTSEKEYEDFYYIDKSFISIEKFKKISPGEISYDFIEGQKYLLIKFHCEPNLTLEFGSHDCVITFYDANSSDNGAVDYIKKTGVLKYYVEKTYGKDLPNSYINPSQYDYLLSVIGDKISYKDYDIYDIGIFEEYKEFATACIYHRENNPLTNLIYLAKLNKNNDSETCIGLVSYQNLENNRKIYCKVISSSCEKVFSRDLTPNGVVREEFVTIDKLLSSEINVTDSILVPEPISENHAVNKKYLEENFYDKSQVDETIENLPKNLGAFENDVGFIDNTVKNLTNYYLKSETYNREEVIKLIGSISTLKLEIVPILPTENISTSTIYLLKSSQAEEMNVYEEYIYINESWEKIGTTKMDLSEYYTRNEANNIFLLKNEKAVDSVLLDGQVPEYYLDYDNLIDAPEETSIIVRDTVSPTTVNVAREIQFGNDVWKLEGGGTVDEEVLKNYVKKEEISTINGTSLLQSNDLSTSDIGINSISSLELEAILK